MTAHQVIDRAAATPPVLSIRDLVLRYDGPGGGVLAVDRVSFGIGAGERLVLLGRSGCGKSSILRACAGFMRPTAGQVLLRGRPVTGPGPGRIVVFQEFDQLLPWKTARENVAFALRHARGAARADANARADAALDLVGLARARDAYPHELSGGMKQRVAIARALAVEPDVLLMDEPFAALDALTRRSLQRELLDVAERLGVTLLFVTHSIEEATLIGTRLHLLSAHPGRTLREIDLRRASDRDAAGREIEALLTGEREDAHV